jgi:hypothetical protein
MSDDLGSPVVRLHPYTRVTLRASRREDGRRAGFCSAESGIGTA